MIRLSWVVFLYAVLLSVESIVIELLTIQLGISALVIAGNSILIAGVALIAISIGKERKQTVAVFRSWKYLVPASALLAVGVYTWYDSVTRVGASKEGLIAGPVEVIVIIILARIFIGERLGRMRTLGAVVALAGFFAAVASAGTAELILTLGDIEALVSAVCFGAGIILVTKLTANHPALAVTGVSTFLCGAILASALWSTLPTMGLMEWFAVLAFSVLPVGAAYTYIVGLARIGASMTATIASFSILLTLLFQIFMALVGFPAMLPHNIPLAISGGSLGVLGIYLIHRKGD